MRYQVLFYSDHKDCHALEDENGVIHYIDLFTDATFDMPKTLKEQYESMTTRAELDNFNRSFKGKIVEIETTTPYIPFYFGNNIKLVD